MSASIPLGLDHLPRHTPATVVEVRNGDTDNDRELALRLLEIGFLPGEEVTVVAHGFPGAEPLAVRIGTTTFALRRHEAQMVRVHLNSALNSALNGAAA